MRAVKIKLNRIGLQTLVADLSNHSMWAIHFMELGTEMSDLVTKTELTKIIAYTFKKLNWLDEKLGPEETVQQGKQFPEKVDSEVITDQDIQDIYSDMDKESNSFIKSDHETNVTSPGKIQEDEDPKEATKCPIEKESSVNKKYSEWKPLPQHISNLGQKSEDSLDSSVIEKDLSGDESKPLSLNLPLKRRARKGKPKKIQSDPSALLQVLKTISNSDRTLKKDVDGDSVAVSKEVQKEPIIEAEGSLETKSEGFSLNKAFWKVRNYLGSSTENGSNDQQSQPSPFLHCDTKDEPEDKIVPHLAVKHKDIKITADGDKKLTHSKNKEEDAEKNERGAGEKKFKCEHCEKRFAKPSKLKIHEWVHTGVKPFSCNTCGSQFTSSSNLKAHEILHTDTHSIFSCSHCDKEFVLKAALTRHELTHTDKMLFSCIHCDKKFSQERYLRAHERTHTNEKSFECEQCDKKFALAQHLKRHLGTHTGYKPFPCSHCDKKFSQASHLSSHERTHTNEKPFECEQCDKKFTQSSTLRRHQVTHTDDKPFPCSHCDKNFNDVGNLRAHERTHTIRKPFDCSFCSKKFIKSSDLKTHEMIHKGEKNFSCSNCAKGFSNTGNLNKHLRDGNCISKV